MSTITLTQQAAPSTPVAGKAIVYVKADGLLYSKNSAGAESSWAVLDAGGKILTSQIPLLSITDTFVVATQAAQVLLTAQVGDVAVRTDESKSYILVTEPASVFGNWQVLLSPTDAVTSVAGKTGVVTLVKADVGLGSVDNTTDANKPISNAEQTALNLKAPLAAPAFTGVPTAPTAAVADNTTQLATTAYALAAAALRYGKNNILGTVSQAVGVPTGAVIERGSNANGEYVRFADGTQICIFSFAQISGATASTNSFGSTSGSMYMHDYTWTYPAAFIARPTVSSGGGNQFAAGFRDDTGSVINTTSAIHRFWHAAPGVAGYNTVTAIGRWF